MTIPLNFKSTSNLKKDTLEQIAMGGCLFGSGGGGTLQSALNLLQNFKKSAYYPTDTVELIKIEEATEGDAVVVAYIGAPAKINKAGYPDGPVQAAIQIQNRLQKMGRKLAYIVPVESGALGFTVACLVAAKLGLKVIDADGAGRAVPSLPQLTFSIAKSLSPNPAIVVNQEKKLCIEVDVTILEQEAQNLSTSSDQMAKAARIEDVSQIIDNLMRPIISEPEFHQFGGLALWIMNHEQMLEALPIRSTIFKASLLGYLLPSITDSDHLVRTLNGRFIHCSARRIFGPGKLVDARLTTQGGFDFGEIDIQSADEICTIKYQNESLIAQTNKRAVPLCTAPDSIAYFLEPSGAGVNEPKVFSNGDLLTEDGSLRDDLKMRDFSIIGIPADPILWKRDTSLFTSFQELLNNMGYHGELIPLINK